MFRVGHLSQSMERCKPRRRPGHPFWKIDLIESPGDSVPAPQVFAVQMDPGSSLGVHFHFQDQFQLVIKGAGTIGRHALEVFSLHYASGHTGYGPLTAGESGMTYYTIRAVTDGPGHYLPACRDEMRPVKKRNVHAHYTSSAELATDTRIGVKELIAQQDNGAAAWSINLARDQSYRAPADSGMRFYVVTGGVVTAAGETAAAFDCFFLSDADKFTELRAQGGDASLLVLQFDTVPSAS